MLDGTISLNAQLDNLFAGRFSPRADASKIYGADTGGAVRALQGSVKIAHASEVGSLVALAREHGLALWPISGGRNFGYGTSLPVKNDALIVDLSGLKNIQYHEESHTVTIEAGVTQADLQNFLTQNKLAYLVPTTGAGPHGSLIGNALDGGYGMTPVSDHFDGLTYFEGYWGNGSAMSDSLAELSGPDMARRWPAGTGLNPRSLLRQSNLGIVTSAALQLAPKQPHSRMVIIQWNSERDFEHGQEMLGSLMEIIPSMTAVLSVNKQRAQATNGDFPLRNPSDGQNGRPPSAAGKPEFTSIATIFGPRHTVAGACKDLKRHLTGAKVMSLSGKQLALLGQLSSKIPAALLSRFEGLNFLQQKVSSLAHTKALLDGRPAHEFLKLAYAANTPAPALNVNSNPAKDNQGLLWFAPLMPLTKDGVRTGLALIRDILHKHGFDALLGMTIRSSRAAIATIPLIFEKTAENSQRAQACYKELVTACTLAGMPPYRLNIESMATVAHLRVQGDHKQLHAQLKAALDPDNIIAPGRYS
jgi:4-cresol dehydrogenase (hydroxylating)